MSKIFSLGRKLLPKQIPTSASILSSQFIQILILAILGSVCANIWTVGSDESAANYTQVNTDLFLTDFSTLIAPRLQLVFYAIRLDCTLIVQIERVASFLTYLDYFKES